MNDYIQFGPELADHIERARRLTPDKIEQLATDDPNNAEAAVFASVIGEDRAGMTEAALYAIFDGSIAIHAFTVVANATVAVVNKGVLPSEIFHELYDPFDQVAGGNTDAPNGSE